MNGKFAMQKAQSQAKVVKPGTLTMNHNWNPNAPVTKINTESIAAVSETSDEQLIARRLHNEDVFDSIMDNVLHEQFQDALEPPLKDLFKAQKCVVWIDDHSSGCLYSPTYNINLDYRSSIIGFVKLTKAVLQLQNQNQCPKGFISDTKIAETDSKQLIFPLACSGSVKAVVQIVRAPTAPFFSQQDVDIASFFMAKFDLYGESLFKIDMFQNKALEFFNGESESPDPVSVLETFFKCRIAEIWKYDVNESQIFKYDNKEQIMVDLPKVEFGIAGFALKNAKTVNERMASTSAHFISAYDGVMDGPTLAVPYEKNKKEIWCAVLRGRSSSFNVFDEMEVRALLPFIVKAINGGLGGTDLTPILTKLLDAASVVVQTLDINELMNVVQEEFATLLDCEKGKLVMIDFKENRLVANVAGEMQRFPMCSGIAGASISEKKIITVMDPDEDSRFTPSVDSEDGIEVSMLMAVPIFDLESQPIATLVLTNKTNGEKFTENDEKIATLFAVFAGVAFQNARHYRTVFGLSNTFVNYLNHAMKVEEKEDSVRSSVVKLMQKALRTHKCDRITFFVRGAKGVYNTYANVGSDPVHGGLFAADAAENGFPVLLSGDAIQSRAQETARSGASSTQKEKPLGLSRNDYASGSMLNVISQLFKVPSSITFVHEKEREEGIYSVPISNEEGTTVGVLEFHFFDARSPDDLKSLREFTSVFSLSFVKLKIPELAVYGYGTVDIKDWIQSEERAGKKVPRRLVLGEDQAKQVFRYQFDLDEWDGIGFYKVVFKIFAKHGFMESFDFKSSHLFNFLTEIRSAYQRIPFANWRHAIDTFQLANTIVCAGRLDRIFSKIELFGLLIAALCHDLGHDGFKSFVEDGSEAQQSQLLAKHSLMESNSCLKAISVIAKDECNIFNGLNQKQQKGIWSVIFDLILATDMAQHFTILDTFNKAWDAGEFDPEEGTGDKLLLMQLVIKAADLGGIVRPYDVAKKRCNFMAEEFYRTGDLDDEKSTCVVYQSGERKRENIDKERTFGGFLREICQPVFEALTKTTPQLNWMIDEVKKNIEKIAQ